MGVKVVRPREMLVFGNFRRCQCRRIQITGNLAGGIHTASAGTLPIVVWQTRRRCCRQSILFSFVSRLGLGNNQKGCSLKQNHFVRIANVAEFVQMRFQQSNVGNQIRDNLAPGFIESFVPNRGSKTLKVFHPARQTRFFDQLFAVLQNSLPILFGDQIHLVDQQKNSCVRGIFFDSLKDSTKVIKVLFGSLTFDIKDINEQFDAPKDGFPIPLKIRFVKGVLSTTIPQIQDQIPQKPNVVVLDVQSGRQPCRVAGQIVGKNNASHGSLSAVGFAHQ
mmetsp:Transcript_11662/g.24040  ORF Transcript_11662/g.24040 Transcript_11662/m.24040 type:complete len:277 (-) Transcript_11662:87-917(-)